MLKNRNGIRPKCLVRWVMIVCFGMCEELSAAVAQEAQFLIDLQARLGDLNVAKNFEWISASSDIPEAPPIDIAAAIASNMDQEKREKPQKSQLEFSAQSLLAQIRAKPLLRRAHTAPVNPRSNEALFQDTVGSLNALAEAYQKEIKGAREDFKNTFQKIMDFAQESGQKQLVERLAGELKDEQNECKKYKVLYEEVRKRRSKYFDRVMGHFVDFSVSLQKIGAKQSVKGSWEISNSSVKNEFDKLLKQHKRLQSAARVAWYPFMKMGQMVRAAVKKIQDLKPELGVSKDMQTVLENAFKNKDYPLSESQKSQCQKQFKTLDGQCKEAYQEFMNQLNAMQNPSFEELVKLVFPEKKASAKQPGVGVGQGASSGNPDLIAVLKQAMLKQREKVRDESQEEDDDEWAV